MYIIACFRCSSWLIQGKCNKKSVYIPKFKYKKTLQSWTNLARKKFIVTLIKNKDKQQRNEAKRPNRGNISCAKKKKGKSIQRKFSGA